MIIIYKNSIEHFHQPNDAQLGLYRNKYVKERRRAWDAG